MQARRPTKSFVCPRRILKPCWVKCWHTSRRTVVHRHQLVRPNVAKPAHFAGSPSRINIETSRRTVARRHSKLLEFEREDASRLAVWLCTLLDQVAERDKIRQTLNAEDPLNQWLDAGLGLHNSGP